MRSPSSTPEAFGSGSPDGGGPGMGGAVVPGGVVVDGGAVVGNGHGSPGIAHPDGAGGNVQPGGSCIGHGQGCAVAVVGGAPGGCPAGGYCCGGYCWFHPCVGWRGDAWRSRQAPAAPSEASRTTNSAARAFSFTFALSHELVPWKRVQQPGSKTNGLWPVRSKVRGDAILPCKHEPLLTPTRM